MPRDICSRSRRTVPSPITRASRPTPFPRGRTLPRVLVTGGAGFIGSHVADLFLARGFDVTIVDDLSSGKRENVPARAKFYEFGVNSNDFASLVSDGQFDVIAHLAGQ